MGVSGQLHEGTTSAVSVRYFSWILPEILHADEKASFNEAYLKYGIWFDHAIKVVSPVCNTQQTFSHRGVMAILEQVGNTEEYKINIKKSV
jgi:hypothetical protein